MGTWWHWHRHVKNELRRGERYCPFWSFLLSVPSFKRSAGNFAWFGPFEHSGQLQGWPDEKTDSSVFLLLRPLDFLVFPAFEIPYSLFGAASHAKEMEWEWLIEEAIFCVHERLEGGLFAIVVSPPIFTTGKVMSSATCYFGSSGVQHCKELGVISEASIYHPQNKTA